VLVLVLVVVVVVVAGTARAEEDGPLARDAPEGPGRRPGLSARRPATRCSGTPSTSSDSARARAPTVTNCGLWRPREAKS